MPLEDARDAAAAGDWQVAYELLVEADSASPLSGPDLPLLAGVAYASGHVDLAINSWERAYRDSAAAGDDLGAAGAAVRVAMHLLLDAALLAPMRGWLTRAEKHLRPHGETPVHAWIAVVRNYERLLSGDFATARAWARRAIELGAIHDPAAAAIGRVAEARAVILLGDVAEGLALLNEAGVAVLAGEIDPLSTGVVFCELICALQALGQYDVAEEWTEAMERWRQGKAVGSIHGRCRIHRAEILRLRGSCAEAETEVLIACDELRPYLRREFGWPLTELGRVRFRRGDIDGAEHAFVAAHQAGWEPQPGLALVHLARGEVARAVASIRGTLERPTTVPSKEWPPNSDLCRAPLLEAQVPIELAAGSVDHARSAAEELGHIAERFESKALAAIAALARGRVLAAEGRADGAIRECERAAQLWTEIGAPYEAAVARVGLADALRATGDEERGVLELRAARAAFHEVGALYDEARAARACGEDEDEAAAAIEPSDAVFRREGEYWSTVFDGQTARVRDSRGLHYLSRLLGSPGRELHVLELVAVASRARDAGPADAGDAGELLDGRAKEAYRRRLAEIDADLEEAQALGDALRTEQAEAEREFLIRELSRAVGLGGRDRRAGSASERARSAVTRAIRHALIRIREHNPPLGEHLERTIRTGACCAYMPDPRALVEWKL